MNEELLQTVSSLIDAGCHYRVEELVDAYTPDYQTVMVQPQGKMIRFDYDQNIEFFRSRRDAGEKPIQTDVQFLAAEVQEGIGFVIGVRTVEPGGGKLKSVFTVMLRKNDAGKWQVFREHAVIARK